MQPIDPMLQQTVWSRVLSTNCDAPTGGSSLTAEALLRLMQDEKNDCATYRYLSRKSCGEEARILKELAADEAQHFKMLHAMYYILTGRCVCLEPQRPACTACLAASLRQQYEQELAAVCAYEAAAEQWPDMAQDFRCLADQERAHSRQLLCLLQYRL